MSSVEPALPNLNLTLGALYIGGAFSTFLFGIATLQTWSYYNFFPNDRGLFKYLVGGLWLLDGFHLVIVTHSAYYYAISNYMNPASFAITSWSLSLGPVVTASVACTCQAFFTARVWILGRNAIITAVCGALCLARFALSIYTTWGSFHVPGIVKYEVEFGWSLRAGLGIATAGDVCIAAAMVYYLSSNRTGIKNTDRLLSRLLTFTVETCLITSTVTVVDLICFVVMPENFVFLGLYAVVAKLYTNALLTSLNSRKSYRATYGGADLSTSGGTAQNTLNRNNLPPMFAKSTTGVSQTQLETIELSLAGKNS
jgi:hypothetical protein